MRASAAQVAHHGEVLDVAVVTDEGDNWLVRVRIGRYPDSQPIMGRDISARAFSAARSEIPLAPAEHGPLMEVASGQARYAFAFFPVQGASGVDIDVVEVTYASKTHTFRIGEMAEESVPAHRPRSD